MTPTLRISLLVLLLACGGVRAQDAEAAKPDTSGPAGASEETAPTIDLPLPWKQGQVLVYAVEQLESDQSGDEKERSIMTATTELRTRRADKDGFEVHWVTRDTTHETLEGDASMDAIVLPAMKQMEGEPMVVSLAPDGTFNAISNIEHMSRRMREVLAPVLDEALEAGLKASAAGEMTEDQRKQAREKARAAMQAFLENFTSPKVLETMASKQARNIAFFNAGGLEDGASYELDTELENPTGGKPFPAKLTFGLWVSEHDPEDVFIEWTSVIDPEKGRDAVIDTAKRLLGVELDADASDLPATISIKDTGLILIHRPTGMIEMYEDEREMVFGDRRSQERHRMRLLDQGHGHEWSEEP